MAKILYAEDDIKLQKGAVEFLQDYDHNVIAASNAAKAIAAYDSTFDVVLTDYNMGPDTDVDLVRHIRQTNKSIPVIMLSATPIDDIKEQYPDFDELNITFVAKPARPTVIEELIRSKVHRYKAGGVSPGQEAS